MQHELPSKVISNSVFENFNISEFIYICVVSIL